MAKQGRKRKPGVRQPNGQLRRPTTMQALNAMNEQKSNTETSVVRLQPHRRGSEAKECESALGRFWLARNTPDDRLILHAGEEYAGLVRRWRAAHGMVSAQAPEEATGTGDGPKWTTVRGWLRDIEALENAMKRASFTVFQATKRLVIDGLDPETRQQHIDALLGLRIIAVERALVRKDHPWH